MAWLDAARRVKERHQFENVDGVVLDATTAAMLCAVADGLKKPENREKFESMELARAVDIGWKLVR